MPATKEARSDNSSSLSVFVGISDDDEPAQTRPLHKNARYVVISSRFIEMCWKLANLFPLYYRLVCSDLDPEEMERYRELFFLYLDPVKPCPADLAAQIENKADSLFSTRTTAAAVRWAMAHEMAHLVTNRNERGCEFEEARKS